MALKSKLKVKVAAKRHIYARLADVLRDDYAEGADYLASLINGVGNDDFKFKYRYRGERMDVATVNHLVDEIFRELCKRSRPRPKVRARRRGSS